MIVFGDPQFEETLAQVVKRFEAQANSARANSLDDLRALLIQAGQLEQAVSDAAENIEMENVFQKLTDKIAECFYAAFTGKDFTGKDDVAGERLKLFRRQLSDCNFTDDFPVTIKIPEGYEFYTLFPEQYCVSALRWLTENPSAKKVLIVGIRSIGTSLSAAVASILRGSNLDVLRFTIRPKGNPFERIASFGREIPRGISHALIVDEGPGISGSSMVAVAETLLDKGVSREKIFFFPGHENPPGIAASEKIRHWWVSTNRYFTTLETIRWNGKFLRELLVERSREICVDFEPLEKIENISNGTWRKFAYEKEAGWPAVHLPFERTKFLCLAPSGEGLLWKFNGLGAINSIAQTRSEKFCAAMEIPVLDNFHGFIATRWINGKRLTCAETTSSLGNLIGNYLCDAAGKRLSETEMFSGICRLAKMAVTNLAKVFGQNETQRIERLAARAQLFFQQNPEDAAWRSYGDGRTAPHEWIRASNGNIFKTDSTGHEADHTIIGKQSVWWDFAGAIVEWNWSDDDVRPLFRPASQRGMKHDFAVSEFFEVAYIAFRLGQTSLCAEINAHDHSEKRRLRDSFDFYRRQIFMRRGVYPQNLSGEIVYRQLAD
jgi:hypothetical protein